MRIFHLKTYRTKTKIGENEVELVIIPSPFLQQQGCKPTQATIRRRTLTLRKMDQSSVLCKVIYIINA
ncbi:hypothetical protein VULLAG_LOCUS23015 [Vulpes lagopus]